MGETCENCGAYGDAVDPTTGQVIYREYSGRMLCASCRVDSRLVDEDF